MRRLLKAGIAALTVIHGDAFSLTAPPARASSVARAAAALAMITPDTPVEVEVEAEDCGCPEPIAYRMNGVSVTGATLRGMELADRIGVRTRASELLGEDGPAVVVFLRHLA